MEQDQVGQVAAADLQGSKHLDENCGCPECDVCDCGCGESGPIEPMPSTIPVEKIDRAIAKVFVAQQRMSGEQAKAFLREERRKRRLAERGY